MLIKLRPGVDVERVLSEVRSKLHVRKASIVFGPYDIIAEVEVADEGELKSAIQSILSVEGVLETLTCVVTKTI